MFVIKNRMLFFTKKCFIADYLEGLTDMHCHVIPDIDDGAKDQEMSLKMLKQYTELGYIGLVATPHIMEGFYDNTAKRIGVKFKEFESMVKEGGFSDFRILAAAEYMMDPGFDDLIDKKEILTVVGNKVLVEMSYLQRSFGVTDQFFNLQQQGFVPILAHPERYQYLTDMYEVLKFKKKGCLLQLNLLSLGGHYGKQVSELAFDLLINGHYEFLGTDAHHPGHFQVLKNITISKKSVQHFEALVERTKENLSD